MSFALPKKDEKLFHILFANIVDSLKGWGLRPHAPPLTMSGDLLRLNIVKDKERRSEKYKKCDAYWLLVVVDFVNPAQDQEIQIDTFEKVETAVFERVIVYKTQFGHVLEAK